MVIVPLAAPVPAGSKLTCSGNDWPGFSVAGKVAPEIANPVPCTAADATVTAAVPDEVRVSVLVEIEFTATSPKARLLALTAKPGAGAGVAIPARVTVAMLFEALVEMARVPPAAPATAGLKVT